MIPVPPWRFCYGQIADDLVLVAVDTLSHKRGGGGGLLRIDGRAGLRGAYRAIQRRGETINVLKLNDDALVGLRFQILREYIGGELGISFLTRKYPFVAAEITRQNIQPAAAAAPTGPAMAAPAAATPAAPAPAIPDPAVP